LSKEKRDVWFRNGLIRKGICHAIHERMKEDPTVYLIGEGAHMKVHFDAPDIERDFSDRVITLPISEDGNTNFAVGMSLLGLKPINDVITSDFLYRAMDSICNTAAKLNFVQPDEPKTLVIRAEFLIGGPTSGTRQEAMFPHVPGLRVAIPSNPIDAHGLMLTSLTTPGVTIFYEDRMIKDTDTKESEKLEMGLVGPIPFGKAMLRHKGKELTIVSYALPLKNAEKVIESNNFDVDLIDLRTLWPLDMLTILNSVSKTKKLLIVEPDVNVNGIGAEIIARLSEIGLVHAKYDRISSPYSSIPASFGLHDIMIPSEKVIKVGIEEMLK
jgi:pyruvate/2-oxoglutarate/acetoin dehydrogenase E1 component